MPWKSHQTFYPAPFFDDLQTDGTCSTKGHFSAIIKIQPTFKVLELYVSITCQSTRSVIIFVYTGKSM